MNRGRHSGRSHHSIGSQSGLTGGLIVSSDYLEDRFIYSKVSIAAREETSHAHTQHRLTRRIHSL